MTFKSWAAVTTYEPVAYPPPPPLPPDALVAPPPPAPSKKKIALVTPLGTVQV